MTAHKDHDVRASLRGFQEGDNLRLLRAKEDAVVGLTRYPGYALKVTWDVPVVKAVGSVKVNVCWHEIVFRNEWGFTERNFLY